MRSVFPVRRQYSASSASQRLTYRSASCWRTSANDLAILLGSHRSSSSVARWSLSAHLHAVTRPPAPMTFLAKYPSSYTSSARRRARPQSSAASFFQAASRASQAAWYLASSSAISFLNATCLAFSAGGSDFHRQRLYWPKTNPKLGGPVQPRQAAHRGPRRCYSSERPRVAATPRRRVGRPAAPWQRFEREREHARGGCR